MTARPLDDRSSPNSGGAAVESVTIVDDVVSPGSAPCNPLLTSTAFLDMVPRATPRSSLAMFRAKGLWKHPLTVAGVHNEWRFFAGDIRRSLRTCGILLSEVDMVGDPVAIMLGTWGDVRLVHDERGSRVIVRICTPAPRGVAISFDNPRSAETFPEVMMYICDAHARARRCPIVLPDHPRPGMWKRREFSGLDVLSLPPGKTWY